MSVQDRKEWERQQRENRIIDLAAPVFFEKGYEFATIIEIAQACGYNKRSIYLYFRDKEELFLAVVLRGLELLYDKLEKASGRDDIRDLGRAYFDFSMSHPDYLKLIMIYEANTCVYGTGKGPDQSAGPFKLKCQARTDAIADLMTRCIDAAIRKGDIHTRLEPVQLMLLLWGQVLGVMQIILMRKDGFEAAYGTTYDALFEAFMEMIAAALSAPGHLSSEV